MAKSTAYSQSEEFVLDRWAQSRDLAHVFKQSTKKMRRRFMKIGEEVGSYLETRAYDFYAEKNFAEFQAYQSAWCISDDDPLVTLAVGGLLPVGFLRVEEPSAYACVYFHCENDAVAAGEHKRFAQLLNHELNGTPVGWLDRTEDENWFAPLYAEIPNTGDDQRIALARNSQQLKQLAIDQFDRLMGFTEPIGNAVRKYLKR